MSRLIIRNSAPGGALKIVILPATERPEESEQTDEPEPERQGFIQDKLAIQDGVGREFVLDSDAVVYASILPPTCVASKPMSDLGCRFS
jgi:hypothetical protein